MKYIKSVLKYIIVTIIFITCIWYLISNYERILTNMITLDYIVVIYIIVFAFLPIASEINLFGFSIKKEIQNLNSRLNDNFIDLKSQIVDFKISSSQNVYNFNYPLSTPEEIKELKHEIDNINLSKQQKTKAKSDLSEKETDIPDNVVFLFKTRYALENILKPYLRYFPDLKDNIRFNLNRIIKIINNKGFINDKVAKITFEVLNICNRGIHGEHITNEYVDFVKKALPVIYSEINDTRERLGYYPIGLCPKCGYNGDLLENRACPSCGNIIKKD